MNNEDKILELFDNYFRSAPSEEVEKDLAYINSIGFEGISFEEYVGILNTSTSFNLKEIGLCDDIAFADLFNNSICPIEMGTERVILRTEEIINIDQPQINYGLKVYYSIAA